MKNSKMTKIISFALVFLTIGFTSIAQNKATNNEEWKLVKAKKKGEGWQIYQMNVSNSKLNQYKIVGKMNCSPKQAQTTYWKMITDPALRITKKGKSLGWVRVLDQTDNEMVVYDFMEGNFMAKARDVIARYTLFEDSTQNSMGIKWKQTDWKGYEATDTIIRMPVAMGSWSFEKIDSENCLATGTYQFHPGGNPPAWLINWVVKKTSPIELEHLRKSLKKD